MSGSNWTWEIDGFDLTSIIQKQNGKWVTLAKFEWDAHTPLTMEQQILNARLASKAPEMLQTLKDVLTAIEGADDYLERRIKKLVLEAERKDKI